MPASSPVNERLWAKVDKQDGNDISCWLWLGTTTKSGHGQIKYGKSMAYVHIVSWHLVNLDWPDTENGEHILHSCDTPNCVNPSHLYLGTKADNIRDMLSRHSGLPTMKLSQVQVDEIRSLGSSYSQNELAKMFDVNQSTIWRIQNYERRLVDTTF